MFLGFLKRRWRSGVTFSQPNRPKFPCVHPPPRRDPIPEYCVVAFLDRERSTTFVKQEAFLLPTSASLVLWPSPYYRAQHITLGGSERTNSACTPVHSLREDPPNSFDTILARTPRYICDYSRNRRCTALFHTRRSPVRGINAIRCISNVVLKSIVSMSYHVSACFYSCDWSDTDEENDTVEK